jgi:hypothetical protein
MNALVEGTYNNTLAFAPHIGQLDSSAATTQRADVFARRERQPTSFSVNEPRWRTVILQIGNRRAVVTYFVRWAGLCLSRWDTPWRGHRRQ